MNSFCTFSVGGRWLGLPVERVREVIRHPAVTPVPLAPPVVAGLINLRGDVLLAIDLRVRLGLPAAKPERPPLDLIFHGRDGLVSLVADEVGPVVQMREEDFEPIPGTVPAATRSLLTGAYKLPDRIVLILDSDRTADLKIREAHRGGR
jgi:purine-binding chemotaxis protein CheW